MKFFKLTLIILTLSILVNNLYAKISRYSDDVALQFVSDEYSDKILEAFKKSSKNKPELKNFIIEAGSGNITSASFLISNMPDRDLKKLTNDFLMENLKIANIAMTHSPWAKNISEELFLNYILPYASLNERRDNWRQDFFNRFSVLVEDCKSSGEAAVKLNNEIWDIIDVHYNTKRPKADQSPYESIEAKMASCTGLSILLIDACRSVGIPARFVGVPSWVNVRGNHSWVEIWDNGWHFLGAGEPGPLNKSWFASRAKNANPDEPKHSIYAVSFKKTDIVFPCTWGRNIDYVSADNVTFRYLQNEVKGEKVTVSIRIFKGSERIASSVKLSLNGIEISKGISPDETRDLNDMLDFKVMPGKKYQLFIKYKNQSYIKEIQIKNKAQKIDIHLENLDSY